MPPGVAQETFICEVEIMKSELTECEVTVEGEFVSQSTMEEWGWSESLDPMFDLRFKRALFKVSHARPKRFLCASCIYLVEATDRSCQEALPYPAEKVAEAPGHKSIVSSLCLLLGTFQ